MLRLVWERVAGLTLLVVRKELLRELWEEGIPNAAAMELVDDVRSMEINSGIGGGNVWWYLVILTAPDNLQAWGGYVR